MKFSEAMITRFDELLAQKNMNVNQVATRAGINPSTIRSMLKKRCKSSKVITIYYICLGFDISMKEFFDSEMFKDIEDDDDEKENSRKKNN